MSFIKKLLKMKYTKEAFIFFVWIITLFTIHQTSWLFISKILLDLVISSISSFFIYIYLNSNDKGFAGLLIAKSSFVLLLFSIVGLLVSIPTYLLDEQLAYTKHYVYQPKHIIKDPNEVILIGNTQILRSDKISEYNSKNLKICKNERYNSARFRLSDSLYICK